MKACLLVFGNIEEGKKTNKIQLGVLPNSEFTRNLKIPELFGALLDSTNALPSSLSLITLFFSSKFNNLQEIILVFLNFFPPKK